MADKIHTIKKMVRLTEEEAEALKKKSEMEGMNEASYIRLLINGKPRDHPKVKMLLQELIVSINRIGNNVNQIAHRMNSDYYTVEDKEKLLLYFSELRKSVMKVVEKLGNPEDITDIGD